jgi:hypothetical protein
MLSPYHLVEANDVQPHRTARQEPRRQPHRAREAAEPAFDIIGIALLLQVFLPLLTPDGQNIVPEGDLEVLLVEAWDFGGDDTMSVALSATSTTGWTPDQAPVVDPSARPPKRSTRNRGTWNGIADKHEPTRSCQAA